MALYRLSFGLGGGFNVNETAEVEADNENEAVEYAYNAARELFEFYGVFENQNPDYDESSEDYEQDYEDELHRWIDYSAVRA